MPKRTSLYHRFPDYQVDLETSPQRVRVSLGGEIVADSRATLTMRETKHEPVVYFPREDVRFEALERTDHKSFCPFKGEASYWTLRVGERSQDNVMWSYEEAVIDADGSFSTTPEHYGGSEVVTYSLVVTDIKGAAPKCDCQLYSGTSDTIANGTKTGDTFTQITAKGGEQKSAEGKAFHPYMWATCVGTGTISTITVGVYSTGKM